MRVMVMVKATRNSEAGVMHSEKLLADTVTGVMETARPLMSSLTACSSTA